VTTTNRKKLTDNLAAVRERIAAACGRVKRRPQEVRLVAVTKSASLAAIKELVSLGQEDLAESRVQQLTQRAEELAAWRAKLESPLPPERWHMVGQLQRNKVKACIAVAQTIHSVDSLRLAEEISLRAQRDNRQLDLLLEVNCSEESQKSGVAVGAAVHLAEQVSTLKAIRLVGLMTMAPLVANAEQARFTFVRLRELFEEAQHEKIGGRNFDQLSMGMSNDFEVAIEEGATIVRIGTALFQ
jgi:hypothetical protein